MSGKITLRPYSAADEDAAIELWRRTWQKHYPHLNFTERVPWWRERWGKELVPVVRVVVAEDNGALIGFLLLLLVLAVFYPTPDTKSLNSDLALVRTQIEDAHRQDETFSGGAIKALIQLRLNTLQQTEALLEQKKSSLLRRVWMNYTVDGHSIAVASKSDLDAVSVDIKTAEEKLKLSTLKAEQYSGGLIQGLAAMTVETDRMSVAQLWLKFYSAKHGLPLFSGALGQNPKPSAPGLIVNDKNAF